jgi:hypothetical protein
MYPTLDGKKLPNCRRQMFELLAKTTLAPVRALSRHILSRFKQPHLSRCSYQSAQLLPPCQYHLVHLTLEAPIIPHFNNLSTHPATSPYFQLSSTNQTFKVLELYNRLKAASCYIQVQTKLCPPLITKQIKVYKNIKSNKL